MPNVLFNVTGMSCDHCVETLSSALNGLTGVNETEVNLADGTARVRFDETVCASTAIVQAVRDAGFQVAGFSRMD